MSQPHDTPQDPPDTSGIADPFGQRRRFWFRAIWISLTGVVVPPLIGVAGTIFGMRKAFDSLPGTGIDNPAELSKHISDVLIYTASGLATSAIAFIALIVASIRFFTLPKALVQPPQHSMHHP